MNAEATTVIAMLAALVLAVLGNLVSEEVHGRLEQVPAALLRLVARLKLPVDVRDGVYAKDWLPELEHILQRSEGLPITRLLRGTWYALDLLRAPKQMGYDYRTAHMVTAAGALRHAILRSNATRSVVGIGSLLLGIGTPIGGILLLQPHLVPTYAPEGWRPMSNEQAYSETLQRVADADPDLGGLVALIPLIAYILICAGFGVLASIDRPKTRGDTPEPGGR
jgi:hypothetical protein